MEMSGEQHIPASREAVWAALNDPDVLRACIPGCQELTKTSDTAMTAVAVVKVGPVSARFQGAVTLSEIDPPNGYRITGEGQGGVAGFAKGSALVRLEPADGGTLLHYRVNAQIGGKLAQLGGRLIDATARKMSTLFFEKFAQELLRARPETGEAPASSRQSAGARPASPVASAAPARPAPARSGLSSPLQLIIGAVLGAAIVLLWVNVGRLPGIAPEIGDRAHLSPDFEATVLLVMAASIGFLFGRLRN